MSEEIQDPCYVRSIILNENPTLFLYLFYREGVPWSLAELSKRSTAGAKLRDRLGRSLSGVGVRDFYAPSPVAFNAQIVAPDEMPALNLLGGDVRIHRNQEKPGDITWLDNKGDAYGFSGGGCALVVVSIAGFLFACHGGRAA